jgi:MFS family permease
VGIRDILSLIGFSPFWGIVYVGFLARSMLMNTGVPIFESYAMEQVNESKQGTLSSVLVLGVEGGFAIGFIFSGIIQENYGFSIVFILAIIFYVVSIILIWKFFGEKKIILPANVISADIG